MWAPISVEIFSSVLVLAREHRWLCLVYWSTRTSAVPTGARPHHKPSNSSSRGTDITFVSNSCLQLSLFICIYFIFFFLYIVIVDQSELLLCPAQVLGRVPSPLRVLRTKHQTFTGSIMGTLARGEINPLKNLRCKTADAAVLASVSL